MRDMSSIEIGEHYRDEVDWGFLSKRQLMSLGLSFEHLAEIAMTLAMPKTDSTALFGMKVITDLTSAMIRLDM